LIGCKKQQAGGPQGGFAVQVVAVEAKRQQVKETLSLVGSIAANEVVEIKAETDGIVQEINFKEGGRVDKGQLLVKLDESKLASALAEAEANLKLSLANYDRAKQLLQDRLISQQEYDQAASTYSVSEASVELKRRQLKDARVHAPFAGIVGAQQISPGQVIARTTT
jgi:membrane fusion protein (multidrug efflux system)